MLLNTYAMIDVQNSDITYTENALLAENQVFDEERRAFLRDFSTLDLQAVPGSGKTTVLLAKLLILEKYMPLDNGRGVLVLSHTNAAINEIIFRIGKFAPNLFRYPNFVGTIQSFVDTFLAIPFYTNRFKKTPYRIDNVIYNERIENRINNIWYYRYGMSSTTIRQVAHILKSNQSLPYNFRFQLIDSNSILVSTLNGPNLEISKPKGRTKPGNYIDYSSQEKSQIYN